MKKLFSFALVLAALFGAGQAFASVGWSESGSTTINQAANITAYGCTQSFDGFTETLDCRTISGTSATFTGNVVFQSNLTANGRIGASSTIASSSNGINPSTLPYSVLRKSIGNVAGETATLPNGTDGQVLTIYVDVCGTSGTWIVSRLKGTNWGTMTFNAAGDTATLLYDSTLGWIITSYTSVTITNL